MQHRLSRRDLLKISVAGSALLVLGQPALSAFAQSAQSAPLTSLDVATRMADAATNFLNTLSADHRSRAAFAFDNEEARLIWGWTPSFPRNGVALTEMSGDEKTAAYALLAASTSSMGYEKVLNLLALQTDLGRDPELYFFTVYGEPSLTGAWGWRLEGYHLSMHFTSVDGQISMSPMFLGALPLQFQSGERAGFKPMFVEEETARALIQSTTPEQRAQAFISTTPEGNIITMNASFVTPLAPVGIPTSSFAPDQQSLMQEVMNAYVGVWPEPIAQAALDEIDLNALVFAWQGSIELGGRYNYYLQGDTFLLDHNNVLTNGNHIHSVWRNFAFDFGQGWLG